MVQQEKKLTNNIINRIIGQMAGSNPDGSRKYSKKHLVPHYLRRGRDYWGIDCATEKMLFELLQIKPRRTASGVATITVMTKPWPCQSACIYCPNDLRMPKSYLTDEPVCQRAQFAYFDPYLQVVSRLRALKQMGHPTDKIEMIVLGGTWSDYPIAYQIWFVTQLFRALNDSVFVQDNTDFQDISSSSNFYKIINSSPLADGYAKQCEIFYTELEITNSPHGLADNVAELQQDINHHKLSYNQAVTQLYTNNPKWQAVAKMQTSSFAELEQQQQLNQTAQHRVVGLVIETRPDTVTPENLTLIRRLGCTKVQMGIQSLQQTVLERNHRRIQVATIAKAHNLLRLFGFKIHIHFMVNLLGSTVKQDQADYLKLVTDCQFLPDEVKLYPCVLVEGTELVTEFEAGNWTPYSETELVDVLVYDTIVTPRWTRISRMIRDISAHDIVAGNKKSNLRQVVEQKIKASNSTVSEIRYREISTELVKLDQLKMVTTCYQTAVAKEYFLEWVTPNDHIAGFLRLSLPTVFNGEHSEIYGVAVDSLPIKQSEAMIREVHIYGRVSALSDRNSSSQHRGLGKQLIQKACEIAKAEDYNAINVISSVGTREYYTNVGFTTYGLYQRKDIR